MSATNPVQSCVTALITTLQSISGLANKTLFVFNEDNLVDQLKGVSYFPAAGIIYEGMRAMQEHGAAKTGESAEMVFSLLIVNRGSDIVSTDTTKTATIALLDDIRQMIIGTKSPTGHFWKFVVEAAAAENKGTVFWVQRWSTPVQLAKRG